MGTDWVREDTVTSLVVGGECLLYEENNLFDIIYLAWCPNQM